MRVVKSAARAFYRQRKARRGSACACRAGMQPRRHAIRSVVVAFAGAAIRAAEPARRRARINNVGEKVASAGGVESCVRGYARRRAQYRNPVKSTRRLNKHNYHRQFSPCGRRVPTFIPTNVVAQLMEARSPARKVLKWTNVARYNV